MPSIRVSVRFFAQHREQVGASEREFDLPPGATVRELLERMRDTESGRVLPDRPTVAVNLEYAPLDRALESGDEVALIPNVAGG